jgi:hypothetical protein
MSSESIKSRRGFIHLTGITGSGLVVAALAPAVVGDEKDKKTEEEVSPAEDLMREHGVLKRIWRHRGGVRNVEQK